MFFFGPRTPYVPAGTPIIRVIASQHTSEYTTSSVRGLYPSLICCAINCSGY